MSFSITSVPLSDMDFAYDIKALTQSDTVEKVTLYENDTILAQAFILKPDKTEVPYIFSHYLEGFRDYSDYEYNKLWEHYRPILERSHFLIYLESYFVGQGYGTELYNILLSKYKSLWFYSTIETDGFWESLGAYEISPGDHLRLGQ